MLRKTLVFLALCCLPAMADSIQIFGLTDSGLRTPGVNGTDFATIDQSSYDGTASINSTVSITRLANGEHLQGQLTGTQGGPGLVSGRPFLYISEFEIAATLNLPDTLGNFFIIGQYDVTLNGQLDSSQPLSYAVNSPVFVISPTAPANTPLDISIHHTAGTPLTVSFFSDYKLYEQRSTVSINVDLSVADASAVSATPEPATWKFLIAGFLTLLASGVIAGVRPGRGASFYLIVKTRAN